ncbi:MFS transporter [Salinilacustrithrix flava]|uniref:MFS transporter n=1 Tax=Salinilacustrithrix flava TaxID=2957203 RepID=UPI003D7C1834
MSRATPARLGAGFNRLWTASVVSNTGDGVMAVALPLLAETLTRQPLLFAGVTVANRLPWLLFSLHAGAIADRVDRRRLMATVNALRALLVAALAAAVLTDVASIWLLYAIGFGLGVAETLFDNASQAFLPALVERDDLERANGRLMAGEIVTNQFLGPPLGGFLFGLGAAVPILLDAGTFAISAGLIASLGGLVATRRPARDPDVARPRMRTDIAEGLRWLRNHRLLRGLAVLLGAMNFTSTMLFAVFPLYAVGEESALGLSGFGFGVLLTTTAAGSTIGSLLSARLVTRFGRGPMLWSTLVASVAVPIVIAATSNALVVGAAFAVFGLAVILWNVITVSLRQTIIPDRLLGRVNSVYRFLGWGSMPLGSLAGGAAAALWGVRTTFVLSGLLMAVPIVVFARVVRTSEIDAARAAATPDHP